MEKAYIIAVRGSHDAVAISLSLETAQEMLMAYAFEDGWRIYNLYIRQGYDHRTAMIEAKFNMSRWYIWEKILI